MTQQNTMVDGMKESRLGIFWYSGTGTLVEGKGMCYDLAYTGAGAGEIELRRGGRVTDPSNANNNAFAGVVTARNAGDTGPCWVELALPGGPANILVRASTTINATRLTCQAGGTYAGYFTVQGFDGRGTALALQTETFSSDSLLIRAWLQDGPESGLVEFVTPVDNDAVTLMVGGVTFFPAATINTGNCTASLAQGTFYGQKKRLQGTGTIGSNDVVVTLATAGIQFDHSTALASVAIDANKEVCFLEFNGGVWEVKYSTGATLAST